MITRATLNETETSADLHHNRGCDPDRREVLINAQGVKAERPEKPCSVLRKISRADSSSGLGPDFRALLRLSVRTPETAING